MSQAPSVAFASNDDNLVGAAAALERQKEQVLLRGTTRGLEIVISGVPTAAALGARLTELLAEAPSFFAGSDARVVFDGALPSGALACLEEVATRFALRIVEISPVASKRRRAEVPRVLRPEDVPQVGIADGTGPIGDELSGPGQAVSAAAPAAIASAVEPAASATNSAPASAAMPSAAMPSAAMPSAAAGANADVLDEAPPGPRLVMGPVRSGVIVDHAGHLIVIGDVNPGAEVRAEGSILVLGRMRGVAHAAIGREAGFIIALSLQPQQLRIGRMVTRAGDADRPSGGAEIAYATGETIVVERFCGRLPSGLAASM